MTLAEYANIALRAGAIAARRPTRIEDIERVAKEVGKHVHIEGKGKAKHLVFDKGDKLAILKLLHDS